eukprot:TRINITY_DN11866_c0_g1::TRINITY_DN11866_c0_g1_i1::g.16450::m.16450 TRINITY_DN11866_c0_g1::TRINITY_DN11866_c0_g1_i1::g.16450  ORF type:complete len:147 (-),score=-7.98,BatA/PF07584.6/0.074,BatA/PF07584.6/7.5e+02 TRINITY_DN11866_c0_g1_i1:280-720(-)
MVISPPFFFSFLSSLPIPYALLYFIKQPSAYFPIPSLSFSQLLSPLAYFIFALFFLIISHPSLVVIVALRFSHPYFPHFHSLARFFLIGFNPSSIAGAKLQFDPFTHIFLDIFTIDFHHFQFSIILSFQSLVSGHTQLRTLRKQRK